MSEMLGDINVVIKNGLLSADLAIFLLLLFDETEEEILAYLCKVLLIDPATIIIWLQ